MKNIFLLLAVILFNSLFIYCGNGETQKLKIVEEYKLRVPEPSGLALSADGKNLWTVSDQTSTVYMISFKGKIVNSFKVDAGDLEGVAVISDTSIAVVAERTREIIFINNNGKEFFRKKLLYDAYDNEGLEGVTINKNNEHIFIVKEKKPKVLIEFDKELKEVNRTKINFANDLSGLDFINETNDLWITSDESKLVAKCSTDGKVKEKYKVTIDQVEGIAVDTQSNVIYLVSDKEEKLYVLKIK